MILNQNPYRSPQARFSLHDEADLFPADHLPAHRAKRRIRIYLYWHLTIVLLWGVFAGMDLNDQLIHQPTYRLLAPIVDITSIALIFCPLVCLGLLVLSFRYGRPFVIATVVDAALCAAHFVVALPLVQ